MDHNELLEKYQALLFEYDGLKAEITSLKAKLGIPDSRMLSDVIPPHESAPELPHNTDTDKIVPSGINIKSDYTAKIKLFMSLFRGRDDVYAKRWENRKKGTFGYSPVCRNEWVPGLCAKPKGTCAGCASKAYIPLDETVIDDHLRGRDDVVTGIYPMLRDETCWFLAIDFDGEGWQKDISALRDVCSEFTIHLAVERSRSGNGAHAWFFFEEPMPATLARKFGTALLTYTMSKRHEITFKSYDRFFPNQDTMPKGGLGNLIALPLQKAARKNNHSEFIDENFNSYNDQWAYLSSVRKLSVDDIASLASKLCSGNELGVLKIDEEEAQKPWEQPNVKLVHSDFPKEIVIVRANMLFVPKTGISQRALNQVKRLAAFKNPEFYKAQAMRMSTYGKNRVICCAEETGEYICLPRGSETDLNVFLAKQGIDAHYLDKTNSGRSIDVEFNGALREEQPQALEKLLKHDIGVLSGTTAFGKTIVAIKLIAERKVNTLILVDRVNLISQWEKRLSEFLTINEVLPQQDFTGEKKKGRKKVRSVVGNIKAGKDNLSGIIDIAVMQSLNKKGEVRECVKNYGMIIVDECHHVSAFSFESILKSTTAKYVYGLTATPTRKDGRHPIIFMQCGPIRYRDDAKKQAEKRPFEHYIIPRFTSLRVPLGKNEEDLSIQELYSDIVGNELRNQFIINDVLKNHKNDRNCIVLTERTAHVELLVEKLRKEIPGVIALTGGKGTKETREILSRIAETPPDQHLTLVATGKYVGEGFDEPRLDTLFLAMPISWKGTLQQYAGRLHRLFEGKQEVQVYDYVDIHVRKLERMYNKRLSGYSSIGYKAKGESITADPINFIFDKSNFLPVYANDIENALREILIVSPFITRKRTLQMMDYVKVALQKNAQVIVVTRPIEDFKGKDVTALQGTLDLLQVAGVKIIFRPNIHQKFAVMDNKIVWYGSINLLSFGSAEESIMRLESPNIAHDLIESIIKTGS